MDDITIDGNTTTGLKNGAFKVIEKIKPMWKDLVYKIYTDGITNKLIGVWNETNKKDQILIRVYGKNTELFIDRTAETQNIKLLHKHGLGPPFYGSFKNGICYGFIAGSTLNTETVVEETIWKETCKQTAKLHKIKIDTKESFLFPKIDQSFSLLPEEFTPDQQKRLEAAGISKEYLREEVSSLQKILESLNCPVVFSHNDNLLGNIIWNKEDKTVHFIDYEYAGPNFQAFDLGNHFNEFAGIETVDYDLYPSIEFQKKWIREYLKHYMETEIVEDALVEKWTKWSNKFALASHLFWATWALFQACNSTLDFDFLGYSLIRLKEYQRRKEEFLAM